jgi:cytochrome P450
VRERFAAAVRAECDCLIEGLVPRGRAELLTEFAGPLAAGVLTRALGFDPADAPKVRGWYEDIVAAVSALSRGEPHEPDTAAAGRAAYGALASRLGDVIADHGQGSLLAAAAHDADGTLSIAELAADAGVLLFGGIETTEGMIATAVLHVLRSPDTAARLRGAAVDSDPLVAAAVEESLRLEPAAAMVDRYATTDIELGNALISAGDLVHVSLTAANRDPAVFDDPDRFRIDPLRPPRHLAFAQGPHVCLGVHLARLEARVALARLCARLPGLRLDPEYPAEVRGIVFRKPPTARAVGHRYEMI